MCISGSLGNPRPLEKVYIISLYEACGNLGRVVVSLLRISAMMPVVGG